MKQLKQTLLALTVMIVTAAQAQSSNDFQTGSVTTYSNEVSSGNIKPMFKTRGVIIFQNSAQQKQQLSPNEIARFTLGNDIYVSHTNDFYRVVVKGDKAQLFERVTNNGGKVYYNGAQPVNTPSLDGKIGDFYVLKQGSTEPVLVSGSAFQRNAMTVFGDCSTIAGALSTKTVDAVALKNLVGQYNDCR